MRIFLSWHGNRSKELARRLKDWLPLVIHYAEPWFSDIDIDAGERWFSAVSSELSVSNFGIICLTQDNLNSNWILFEAGALAKLLDSGKVIPLLMDLEISEISGPLAQFQVKKLTKSGIYEILQSIQRSADQPIPEDQLSRLFDALWPGFEENLSSIPEATSKKPKIRSTAEILEDLVTTVRSLDIRIRKTEHISDEETLYFPKSKINESDLLELDRMINSEDDNLQALTVTLLKSFAKFIPVPTTHFLQINDAINNLDVSFFRYLRDEYAPLLFKARGILTPLASKILVSGFDRMILLANNLRGESGENDLGVTE